MIVDILVAEIGSTTTKMTAFDGIHDPFPRFLGQGFAPTTVLKGDVTLGLKQATDDLKARLKVDTLEGREVFACSSAAGGLKMSVHGLVYDMTAKAAKEAALGAGANLKLVTAGLLPTDILRNLREMDLNIILIAGGVEHGDTQTALKNAIAIAGLGLNIPVIYAGNTSNQEAIRHAFEDSKQAQYLTITENVYPKIDVISVDLARKAIQKVFEEHIIKAPGMEKVRTMVNQTIMPTPGAVMKAAILLQKAIGDLVVADVGGATTDIHSVTEGSPEIQKITLNPEPFAKRTVEGDLGVFVNRANLIAIAGEEKMEKDLDIPHDQMQKILENYQAIPDINQIPVVEYLTRVALISAIERHVGRHVNLYGSGGRRSVAEGKDLTNVTNVIGTGGALVRLPSGNKLLTDTMVWRDPRILLPRAHVNVMLDQDYIMAAAGAISDQYPEAALRILKESLRVR